MSIDNENNEELETDGALPDGSDDNHALTQDEDDLATLDNPDVPMDERAELAFVMGVEKALPDAVKPKPDAASHAPAAATPAPAPAPGAPPAAAKEAPDAAVEAEIKALGLKPKSAERFRELTSELAASKPMREELAKLKIEKPEQLTQIMGDAKFGAEMNDAIARTSATPEQFGNAFTVIGAMNSGQPELMGRALDLMVQQCQQVAQALGRDLNFGNLDVLDKHPDLKQAVELGETTREIALQLAQQRGAHAVRQQTDQRNQQAAQHQAELTKVQEKALADIGEFGRSQAAANPAEHQARMQALQNAGVLDRIMRDYPASRWESETVKAYYAVKIQAARAPAAAQPTRQAPRPGNVPVRGGNPNVRMQPKPTSELDAFRMGMMEVSPHLDGGD